MRHADRQPRLSRAGYVDSRGEGTGRHALHHEFLQENEGFYLRWAREHREGHHGIPVRDELGHEAVNRHGEHAILPRLDQNHGEEELVPGQEEGVEAGADEGGVGERQQHPEDGPEPGAAVHHRGLFHLAWDVEEVAAEHENAEGQGEGQIHDDERGPRVIETERDEDAEIGNAQEYEREHLRRDEEHQYGALPGEPEAGERIGGGRTKEQRQRGYDQRNDHRVEEDDQELLVRKNLPVAFEREDLRDPIRRDLHDLEIGAHRHRQHPQQGNEDDRDRQDQQRIGENVEQALAASLSQTAERGAMSHGRSGPHWALLMARRR